MVIPKYGKWYIRCKYSRDGCCIVERGFLSIRSLLNTALSAAQSLAKFCPGSAYLSGGVSLVCQDVCLLEASLWALPTSGFWIQKGWLEIFGFLKFSAYSKKFFSRSRRNAVKRLIRDDSAHSGTDKSGFQSRSSNCKSHLYNLGKQQPVAGRQLWPNDRESRDSKWIQKLALGPGGFFLRLGLSLSWRNIPVLGTIWGARLASAHAWVKPFVLLTSCEHYKCEMEQRPHPSID